MLLLASASAAPERFNASITSEFVNANSFNLLLSYAKQRITDHIFNMAISHFWLIPTFHILDYCVGSDCILLINKIIY